MKYLKKILLRIFIVYLFFYIFPFPLNHVPFGIGVFFSDTVTSFWRWLTPIFAKFLFNYNEELSFWGRGSGDTRYDYFLVTLRLTLAFALVLVLSLIDRLKRNESTIYGYIIVVLRFYLAFTMFSYGFSKVFYLQFPELNLMNLTRTYGDSSPMGLLWKFMGHSEAYSIFAGALEVLGGTFLLFRKTKVLGVLLTFAVMLNVFVLNMTFDVPVKLFSFHLCLISLFLILPDYDNIVRFFFLNKPTVPKAIMGYSQRKLKKWLGYGLKFLLIGYVLYGTINEKIKAQKQYGKRAPKHQLYGVYDIKSFVLNMDTLPPVATDTLRWKTLIVDKKYSLVIKMDDTRIGMKHEIDSVSGLISLKPHLKKHLSYDFQYRWNDSTLILHSYGAEDTIRIVTSKRRDRKDFFLEHRGFHWINEYPMQR